MTATCKTKHTQKKTKTKQKTPTEVGKTVKCLAVQIYSRFHAIIVFKTLFPLQAFTQQSVFSPTAITNNCKKKNLKKLIKLKSKLKKKHQ